MFGIDDMALGMVGGGALSAIGASSANATNKEIANDNRMFQLQMSNSAYQRATKDMEAAGINPMLAYMQGGASTGSGSGASVQNEMSDLGNSITNSAKTMGLDKQALQKNLEQQDAQIEKTEAETQAIKVGSAKNAAISPAYDLGGKAIKGISDWLQQKTAPVGSSKGWLDNLKDMWDGFEKDFGK